MSLPAKMGTSFFYTLSFLFVTVLTSIPRPRGVAISMASFYQPDRPFRCLDGSTEVPFDYVNDDYCDCPDGSDEPGTSACDNGKFHCTNAGYLPQNILSSRVNDGICDCCDGTDEWGGNIQCVNNCKELGKKLKEEEARIRQLQDEGYKKKLSFSEEGKKTKEEKKAKLEQIEKDRVDLEARKTELEAKKNEAEAPEKEAKEKHEKAWEEEKERRKEEKEKMHALIAFDDLDTNKDKILTVHEMRQNVAFDKDKDGNVAEQEAKEHLEDVDEASFDHFMEKVWPNIKEFYKPSSQPEEEAKGENEEQPPSTEPPPPPEQGTPPFDPSEHDSKDLEMDEDEEEEYDEDDDEDDDDDDEVPRQRVKVQANTRKYDRPTLIMDNQQRVARVSQEGEKTANEEEEKMPDYDEETQKLIQVADEARGEFNEADNKLRDVDREIGELKSYLALDFGPDEEFSTLKENCFEYTDREYTYKLCPFDKASQRPKSGGAETTLGRWGHWDGPAENKYSAQKYDHGQNCWNGPDRSVKVILSCGLEHKLMGASEPSRCEYQFEFATPARCTALPPPTHPPHTEL